jgi:putative flippase GtrA
LTPNRRTGRSGTLGDVAPPTPAAVAAARARRALGRSANWIELLKFSLVGLSGYAVNLAVYVALLNGAGMHYLPAAVCSFVVAVTNNYVWNRHWTFQQSRGNLYYQGMRFFLVSVAALALNLALLQLLIGLGAGKVVAQAVAIVLVTPFSFSVNKLWSFRK